VSQPFLITGLPRSRTAWWSQLATTRNSLCIHEPTPHLKDFDALKRLWTSVHYDYVGMSDAALGFQISRILTEIEPRTLIIHRRLEDSLISFQNFMQDDSFDAGRATVHLNRLSGCLNAVERHPLVRVVAYDQLNDVETVKHLFHWLLYGHADLSRVEPMMRLNVQVRQVAAVREAKIKHSGWHLA
jgi:hypothetical protein